MTESVKDSSITERLISWINDHYPGRGKFTKLEADSKIPAQRWKNAFYRRQYATQEMLDFIDTLSTTDAGWIRTGVKLPAIDDYPFLTTPPTPQETQTLAGRLIWVIKEWTSPRGSQLFSYLENRSNGAISADEWASVILRNTEPSLEMVRLVCKIQSHFTEWILLGGVNKWNPQVDPANHESVERWKKEQAILFEKIDAALSADLDHGNKED
ncbi:hypothetical protein [Alcaligenes phenolicus]|uniref:hypothetical protein n=1 Tax=Alcaligenes phenolicus TaxID=232846 RepID=UPI002AA5EED9|nr:hypothetical protein [Alcaligenes phenolicus]